jgi:RNA polymerase sigma factor (TIGR02999 family)
MARERRVVIPSADPAEANPVGLRLRCPPVPRKLVSGARRSLVVRRSRRVRSRLFAPSASHPIATPGETQHPMAEPPASATDLLLRANAGEADAVERIVPLVYDELRHLAHRHLSREADGRTLTTTELVHEAYLRLIDHTRVAFNGRTHFMAIAATAMRHILVDRARARRSLKRGGPLPPLSLDQVNLATEERADLLMALDEALDRLRALDERQARVVECRFFGGMSEEETAEAIGIGLRTAKRDWAKARSWLYRELYGEHPPA